MHTLNDSKTPYQNHTLMHGFSLPYFGKVNEGMARDWARLAIVCLALSGLAPLLLIAGRASMYAEMDMVREWFIPVLVIHVNLSVGLWFLACFGLVQALCWQERSVSRLLHQCAVGSFFAAICLFVLAPFQGGEAYTSNYIPVQNNILFFLGLGLVASSMVLVLVQSLLALHRDDTSTKRAILMSLTLFTALACFTLSVAQHPGGYGGEAFYEAVFWGGGHILQNLYVMLLMLAWLWIAAQFLPSDLRVPSWVSMAFYMLTLATVVSPLVYMLYDVDSYGHITFFTWQMNSLTGPATAIVALPVMWVLWRSRKTLSCSHPAFIALMMSLLLFFGGGVVGYAIHGSNVTIPAHYHGSTVGVTLALMGVFYLLLPRLTGIDLSVSKVAKLQPVLYGGGQLVHVIGLAWAGGHNVARKTAGGLGAEQIGAELALQVMRIGGLVAVIGGGLFVFLMLKSFIRIRSSD